MRVLQKIMSWHCTDIHTYRHVGVPCGVQRLMNSSSTVTWLLDEVLIARQHTWQGAGGLRNRSIMSSAAVMNPTHATHKPHNSLQYCWSGFIHIWQFRLMVLFRFACRKTQQVIHTQLSHTRMHTSLLMWDNLPIMVNCEAELLTISSYISIAMDCHDTTGTCVTSYECDVINWLHLRHTW